MTDYAADPTSFAGTATTERSGAGVGVDTVPVNCTLLMRNTGAGAHNVTLVVTATYEGLTVPNRVIALTAGQVKIVDIPGDIGDANGRVALSVDATSAEVKYSVIGL